METNSITYIGRPCKYDHDGLRYKSSSSCVECMKVTARKHHLNRSYGLDDAAYQALMVAQNHVCAVCHQSCDQNDRLSVDHCHKTGKIRGLLCNNCNVALGRLKDDPEIIRQLLSYAEAPSQ